MFGSCELGDKRRTKRLVTYASQQAAHPEASTHEVCEGNDALCEGAGRFLRNPNVSAEAIHIGAFQATIAACQPVPMVLVIQDSTSLEVTHRLAKELQCNGSPSGFMVHTGLLVDAQNGKPLGLGYQKVWLREKGVSRRTNRTADNRPREEKESYKWEACAKAIQEGFGEHGPRRITVCDREADQWDFMMRLKEQGEDFTIRAQTNRWVNGGDEKLWTMMAQQEVLGIRKVSIAQRGGQWATNRKQKARSPRPARTAICEIRGARVDLCKNPKDRKKADPSLTVHVVWVREIQTQEGEEPIEWMLLTTLPIETLQDVETVIRYYETRWLIEDYHKAWKTGCQMETRALQSLDAILRLAAITAHIAVRLLQLQRCTDVNPEAPCTQVLSMDEWQCLWVASKKSKAPLPETPPSLAWAMSAIAHLAGWRDTKRTGIVGWSSMWKGWLKLQERVIGWRDAREFFSKHGVGSKIVI